MSYVRTTAALTAIREVLDSGKGTLRTIDPDRFSDRLHQGFREEELQRRGIGTEKPFQVRCTSTRPHASSPGIFGSVLLYDATFEIVVSRTVTPAEQVSSDVMAVAQALAIEDSDIIRQALSTPPNLSKTSDGLDTGIAGASLVHQSSTVRLVSTGSGPSKAQRLETVHAFTGALKALAEVPAAPVFTTSPTAYVGGAEEAELGSVLIASPGIATNAQSHSGQWLRDGQPIEGATGTTYTITESDVGAILAYRSTARGLGGEASATSNAIPVANTPEPLDYSRFTLHGDAFIDEEGNLVLPSDGSYASLPIEEVDPRFYSDGGGWEIDCWPDFSSDEMTAATDRRPILNWQDPDIAGLLSGVSLTAFLFSTLRAARCLFYSANGSVPMAPGASQPQAIDQTWSAGQKITVTMHVHRRGMDFYEQSSAAYPPANGLHRMKVSGMTSGDGEWNSFNAQPHFRGPTLFIGRIPGTLHQFTGKISPLRYSPAGDPSALMMMLGSDFGDSEAPSIGEPALE